MFSKVTSFDAVVAPKLGSPYLASEGEWYGCHLASFNSLVLSLATSVYSRAVRGEDSSPKVVRDCYATSL